MISLGCSSTITSSLSSPRLSREWSAGDRREEVDTSLRQVMALRSRRSLTHSVRLSLPDTELGSGKGHRQAKPVTQDLQDADIFRTH